jgi:lysophospholipase L1-like esterase
MKKIFWIGDSTVHFNRIDTFPQTGMGQVMDLYLKPEVCVRDFAENGRSTKSFFNEGLFEPVKEEMKAGDYLFIQFGHNDSKPDEERKTEPYGSYQEYLKYYIEEARKKGVFPVLLTPISRRHFDEKGNFLDGSHGEFPNAMKALALKEDVPCIDLTKATADFLKNVGDEKSVSWFMNIQPGESRNPRYVEGKEDNTHLKYVGAVIMAGFVAEGLYHLGGQYKEFLLEGWESWKFFLADI